MVNTFTATFTNPERNYDGAPNGASEDVALTPGAIERLDFGDAYQTISTCGVIVSVDIIDRFSQTTLSTNPIQENSTVLIQRIFEGVTRTWFRGYVHAIPMVQTDDGNILALTLYGKEGSLEKALCRDASGNFRWTLETSSWKVTEMPLQPTSAYGTFQGSTLWPDPGDADGAKSYIKDASSNSDTLDTTILIGDSVPFDVILSTSDEGFTPRGWLKIDSEFMYYDGYDDDEADNKFRCRVTARAQLGTSAAQHTAGATVFEKLAKQIAPSNIVLEVDDGDGFVKQINGKQFKVNAKTGFFIFVETTTDTWRGTYSIYDEDKSFDAGSTVISLNDIVEALCTSPVEFGGAGFSAGDLDFSIETGNIFVNRYDYDPTTKPQYALAAINQVIATIGFKDEIQFNYKHFANKLRLRIVGNSANVATVPFVEVWDTDKSLENVNSMAIVQYNDDQSINSATVDFAWHQAATGSGNSPDLYESSSAESADFNFKFKESFTAAGTIGLEFAVDGRDDTKIGGLFKHDPTGDFDHSHWWFGTGVTPVVVDLNRIEIRINNYRVIGPKQPFQNSNKTYLCRIDGCVDYNSSSHTGTWQELGCFMTGEPSVNGGSVKGNWTAFLLQRVNAIRVVWEFMPGPKEPNQYYGVIHDLFIVTNNVKFAEVQLTDDVADKGDSTKIFAPDSFRKLRGGIHSSTNVAGTQRPIWHRIGASSDGAAVSLARTLLKTNLVLYESKRGEYTGPLPVKPDLGTTVTITETPGGATYTGALRSSLVTVTHDEIRVIADVFDYDAAVIT